MTADLPDHLRPVLPPPEWDPRSLTLGVGDVIGVPCQRCGTDTGLTRTGALCRDCHARRTP